MGVDQAAAAEADDEAAAGEVVDEGDLLGHAQRVVERGLQDGEADFDPGGGHGEGGGEGGGVDVNAVAVEVVLGEEDGVHAQFFGKLCLGDGLVDGLGVKAGVAGFVEEEDAEAHGAGSLEGAGLGWHARIGPGVGVLLAGWVVV